MSKRGLIIARMCRNFSAKFKSALVLELLKSEIILTLCLEGIFMLWHILMGMIDIYG